MSSSPVRPLSWANKEATPRAYLSGSGPTTTYNFPLEWPGTICVTFSRLCPSLHPPWIPFSRATRDWIKNRSTHCSPPRACIQSINSSQVRCMQSTGESQRLQRSEGKRQDVAKPMEVAFPVYSGRAVRADRKGLFATHTVKYH